MASPLDVGLPMLLVIAGIALVVAEAVAPGAHLIVLGVALLGAGLVGLLISALFPALLATVAGTFLLALLVLVIGGAALYVYREYDFYGGKGRARTADVDSLRGRTGRVTERVTASEGQVKLDGGGFNPYYAARTVDDDIPVGTEVIVVDPGGGNVVTVESMAYVDDDIERELAEGRERASDAEGGDGATEEAAERSDRGTGTEEGTDRS